jgi:hypothetical protein
MALPLFRDKPTGRQELPDTVSVFFSSARVSGRQKGKPAIVSNLLKNRFASVPGAQY